MICAFPFHRTPAKSHASFIAERSQPTAAEIAVELLNRFAFTQRANFSRGSLVGAPTSRKDEKDTHRRVGSQGTTGAVAAYRPLRTCRDPISNILPRDGGIFRTQALPRDPDHFDANGLGAYTSPPSRERLALRCMSFPLMRPTVVHVMQLILSKYLTDVKRRAPSPARDWTAPSVSIPRGWLSSSGV